MWMRSQCHENTFVVISVASIVAVLVAAVVCYEMLSHVTRCTRCWNGGHWAPFPHHIHVIAVAANVLKAVIKIWLNFSNHFCLVGLASDSAVAVITFAQIWAEADPSIISWWTIFCNILVISYCYCCCRCPPCDCCCCSCRDVVLKLSGWVNSVPCLAVCLRTLLLRSGCWPRAMLLTILSCICCFKIENIFCL